MGPRFLVAGSQARRANADQIPRSCSDRGSRDCGGRGNRRGRVQRDLRRFPGFFATLRGGRPHCLDRDLGRGSRPARTAQPVRLRHLARRAENRSRDQRIQNAHAKPDRARHSARERPRCIDERLRIPCGPGPAADGPVSRGGRRTRRRA